MLTLNMHHVTKVEQEVKHYASYTWLELTITYLSSEGYPQTSNIIFHPHGNHEVVQITPKEDSLHVQ